MQRNTTYLPAYGNENNGQSNLWQLNPCNAKSTVSPKIIRTLYSSRKVYTEGLQKKTHKSQNKQQKCLKFTKLHVDKSFKVLEQVLWTYES